jgi:hypothetical protein
MKHSREGVNMTGDFTPVIRGFGDAKGVYQSVAETLESERVDRCIEQAVGQRQLDAAEARLRVATEALREIAYNYPSDMAHVDYRVRAYETAIQALAAIDAEPDCIGGLSFD